MILSGKVFNGVKALKNVGEGEMDPEKKRNVLDYVAVYYKKNGESPSRGIIQKKCGVSNRWFANEFGSLGEALKQAGVPVDQDKINQTKKARETKKRKLEEETSLETGTTKGLDSIYKQSQALELQAVEWAKDHASQTLLLCLDPRPEVYGPVLDALREVIPKVLKQVYGVESELADILDLGREFNKLRKEGLNEDEVLHLLPEWGCLSKSQRRDFGTMAKNAEEAGISVLDYHGTIWDGYQRAKSETKKLRAEAETLKKSIDNLEPRRKEFEDLEEKIEYNKGVYGRNRNFYTDKFTELDGKLKDLKQEVEDAEKERNSKISGLNREVEDRGREKDRIIVGYGKEEEGARLKTKEAKDECSKQQNRLERLNLKLRKKARWGETITSLKKKNGELALSNAGKWLNKEEAVQKIGEREEQETKTVEGVFQIYCDKFECQVKDAKDVLPLLDVLGNRDLVPDDEFNEVLSVLNRIAVYREMSNPENRFFEELPDEKKRVLGLLTESLEEYQRLCDEKLGKVKEQQRNRLRKIREDYRVIGWCDMGTRMAINIAEIFKPGILMWAGVSRGRERSEENDDDHGCKI